MKRHAAIAVLLLMAAPPAAAQQDGVFVDPQSPAGKEYAVPLDQARGEASGGGDGTSSRGAPLFGEGIEPAPDSATKRGGDGERGNRVRARDRQSDERGKETSPELGASSAAIEAAASESSDGVLTAGIAGLVLLAGLAAGFGLRRLLRQD